MTGSRRLSIRRKLYLIIMGTVAAALLISLFSSLAIQYAISHAHHDEHYAAVAMIIADNSGSSLASRDRAAASAVLASLQSQDDVLHAELLDTDGNALASYRRLDSKLSAPLPLEDLLMPGIEQPIVVERDVMFEGNVAGLLRITGDLTHLRPLARWLFGIAALVFAVALVVALILSARLQRIISIPLQRLSATMTEVAETGDFRRRADIDQSDELGALGKSFNDMLEELDDADRELDIYREDLEQQVDERTRELVSMTERAVAASQAKIRFIAAMSHEIRTPMTGVIGFSHLLAQTELNPQQRDYVAVISSSANALMGLIDEVLDYASLDAGKARLDLRNFDVDDLVNAIKQTLSPSAMQKGLVLTTSRDIDVPAQLHGDPLKIQQVITNLVTNAIKFTARGSVDIQVTRSEDSDAREWLRVDVSDTGPGIDKAQQKRLFEPFEQADAETGQLFGGAGLGLSIVQRLVAVMQGRVACTSTPGEGSVFTVWLPLQAALETCEIPEDSTPGLTTLREKKTRVLLVDDHVVNRRLAHALLSQAGAEIVEAGDGASAVKAFAEGHFDVVLMDLALPDISGIEATEQIRRLEPPGERVAIIAITAYASDNLREQIDAARFDAVLHKPYLPEQLYAAMNNSLDPGSSSDDDGAEADQVWNRTAALANAGNDEQVADLIRAEFLRALPESETALTAACERNDLDELSRQGHRLAGAAAMAGAEAVRNGCLALSRLLKSEPASDDLAPQVEALLRETARFRLIVEAALQQTQDY